MKSQFGQKPVCIGITFFTIVLISRRPTQPFLIPWWPSLWWPWVNSTTPTRLCRGVNWNTLLWPISCSFCLCWECPLSLWTCWWVINIPRDWSQLSSPRRPKCVDFAQFNPFSSKLPSRKSPEKVKISMYIRYTFKLYAAKHKRSLLFDMFKI